MSQLPFLLGSWLQRPPPERRGLVVEPRQAEDGVGAGQGLAYLLPEVPVVSSYPHFAQLLGNAFAPLEREGIGEVAGLSKIYLSVFVQQLSVVRAQRCSSCDQGQHSDRFKFFRS
ncbi:unnamed protein product [Linum tenue]|uniref:Uncharacterized protein n=1 Tax=Linum tenue TaxID=586396 RepID=A0AAV0PY52_9ROSI|nr:unnamed protein product [Linum tenue]CAI0540515.1 unnamed protein product [Linum tenue]